MRVSIADWIRSHLSPWLMLLCVCLITSATSDMAHAREPTKYFDIKSQPLSEALMAVGAQTGAIVMASSELTTGKTSKPVTGLLTLQEALNLMLQGTGLRFEANADGSILIVRAAAPVR